MSLSTYTQTSSPVKYDLALVFTEERSLGPISWELISFPTDEGSRVINNADCWGRVTLETDSSEEKFHDIAEMSRRSSSPRREEIDSFARIAEYLHVAPEIIDQLVEILKDLNSGEKKIWDVEDAIGRCGILRFQRGRAYEAKRAWRIRYMWEVHGQYFDPQR